MSKAPVSFSVTTYGCKVNTYDAGLIQERLRNAGMDYRAHSPQVHILNTCAVTAEATKEAVRQARRLKKKDPHCVVVVTGCAAQVDTDAFKDLETVDLVIANSHKTELSTLVKKQLSGESNQKIYRSNIFRKGELEEGGGIEAHHTRSFLKIQDGCNSFCTYCVIPYARGRSRSLPILGLVERVNQLYEQGVREVVLTGVHIGDYEDTIYWGRRRGVEGLVEALLRNTNMPRFRLSSLEPVEISEELLEMYQSEEQLCPHFHMSIQSAATPVLRDMKRNYSAEDVEKSLQIIAEKIPGSFVGMDVIVGFPSESRALFAETRERLLSLPWTRLHVFPYSERPGTKAADLSDSVLWQERKQRCRELRQDSSERFIEHLRRQVGTIKKVLPLAKDKPWLSKQGLSRDYWKTTWEFKEAPQSGSVSDERQLLIQSFEKNPRVDEAILIGKLC